MPHKLRSIHLAAAAGVEHHDPPAGDLIEHCSSVLALIFATDLRTTPLRFGVPEGVEPDPLPEDEGIPRPLQSFQGQPLVRSAVETALACHFKEVMVVVDAEAQADAEAIAEVLRDLPVRSVSLDKALQRDVDADGSWFSFLHMSKGRLAFCQRLVREAGAEAMLVLAADQVLIRPYHLDRICATWCDDRKIEAVCSWIEWARTTPVLLDKALLDRVCQPDFGQPDPDTGMYPLNTFKLVDVVFDEDRVGVNTPKTLAEEEFFAESPPSALEFVQLARKPSDLCDDVASGDMTRAALNDCRTLLARIDSAYAMRSIPDLERWDEWAQRNRRDFPLLNSREYANILAYLDSAATCQRPASVLQAIEDFDKHENANVYRGLYHLSMQSTASLNKARAAVEAHIGAGHRELIFTRNTTDSINIVAQAWGRNNLRHGDTVLIGISEHHSNLVPWLILEEQLGIEVVYYPLAADGRIDSEAFATLLRRRPKLVCLSHVSNVFGIINPIRELAQMAHAQGARVLLDAAQSIAHLPVRINELEVDFLAFSAHKCYGPMGIGGLWVSPEAYAETEPLAVGGGVISHVGEHSYYLRQRAIAYEPGTPAVGAALGMQAGIEYLEGLGLANVAAHARALTAYALAALGSIEGVRVLGDHTAGDGLCGLLSFTVFGVEALPVSRVLGRMSVAVRSGNHCTIPMMARLGLLGSTRIAIGVHTTKADIEACAFAVQKAVDFLRSEEPRV
jgi:cysteine desulfurase/selenocysteine lyase